MYGWTRTIRPGVTATGHSAERSRTTPGMGDAATPHTRRNIKAGAER